MAKIEAERRDLLTAVKKGPDVTELKFKISIHGEDMHYPGEMISGCKLMEKCIDCVTELSNIRDNGDGGLFVHTQASILKPVHMLDAVEIIVWLVKQGSRSRSVSYTHLLATDLRNQLSQPLSLLLHSQQDSLRSTARCMPV